MLRAVRTCVDRHACCMQEREAACAHLLGLPAPGAGASATSGGDASAAAGAEHSKAHTGDFTAGDAQHGSVAGVFKSAGSNFGSAFKGLFGKKEAALSPPPPSPPPPPPAGS